MLIVAVTTASPTVQLTSGEAIFDHVYGQILDMWATEVTVIMSISPYDMQ